MSVLTYHLHLLFRRVTVRTADQVFKLAACAGDAALSDVCFSKLTVDLDRFFTTEAFTDYMSVEHAALNDVLASDYDIVTGARNK